MCFKFCGLSCRYVKNSEMWMMCRIIFVLRFVCGLAAENSKVCNESGYFQCANSSVCVAQFKMCDEVNDCSDGSDESDCDDEHGAKYWDHLFRKRPAAVYDDDPNTTCALDYKKCLCRRREILCQYKGFKSIPDDLPSSGIDLLDFTGNDFSALSSNSLEIIPEVYTLVLVDCNIQELPPGSFQRHNKLQELHMSNNEVSRIHEDTFSNSTQLQRLIFSRNRIEKVYELAFQGLEHLEELDLSHNRLTEVPGKALVPLIRLKVLYLNGNRIRSVHGPQSFPALPLVTLSLVNNVIEAIDPRSFGELRALSNLYLSGNRLKCLKNGTFAGLGRLVALNLNDNHLEMFDVGTFESTPNLTTLDLKNNPFKFLGKRVLAPLQKLQHVYFGHFALCRAAYHVPRCLPRGDGISSQEHLLDSPVLRASVWLMGAVGCAGNLLVLLGRRWLARDSNAVHSLYIRNLALSDLLMGLYLFVIADADRSYRGEYLQHDFSWRHSRLCNFCGFLSALSCQSSTLILSLVTWDRLVIVTDPWARKQPSPAVAAAQLSALWLVAAAVAAAPVAGVAGQYFGDEFYGNNGVCLSLHIHDPYAKGWEYSTVMFVVVNTVALAFICYAYTRMLREIRSSGVSLRSTQESQERAVAQRFGVIVMTDCMCWVPVIFVKLVALAGMQISEALYAWLAVLVLPINSALNPVLYTLTTTRFKQQANRLLGSCCSKKRPEGFESGMSLSFNMFSFRNNSRRMISHRTTQTSLTQSKNGWKRQSTMI